MFNLNVGMNLAPHLCFPVAVFLAITNPPSSRMSRMHTVKEAYSSEKSGATRFARRIGRVRTGMTEEAALKAIGLRKSELGIEIATMAHCRRVYIIDSQLLVVLYYSKGSWDDEGKLFFVSGWVKQLPAD